MLSRSALVLGGNGCLGQAMVKALNAKKWKTLSVDFTQNESSTENALLIKD